MNVLSLFENENLDDIKLGIQVIKTLGLEKQFEEQFEISYQRYSKIFNDIVVPMSNTCISIVNKRLFPHYLKIEYLKNSDICKIITTFPKLRNYFDLKTLDSTNIFWILRQRPELIGELPIHKMSKTAINALLKCQSQLKPYFDESI